MAGEHIISIMLRTAADVGGARQAAAALDQVTQSTDEAARAAARLKVEQAATAEQERRQAVEQARQDAYASMERDRRESEANTRRLYEQQQRLNDTQERSNRLATDGAEAKKKLAAGSNQAGMAALMLGQAIDDAQYGLRGIMNNIPQLVLAFGGGPGLAGVLGVAAVALNQFLNRLEGADFSGTWVGDLKEKFNELTTGMTEEEAEWKKIAEAPLSWIKKGEEAYNAYAEAATKELQAELDKVREVSEAIQTQTRLKAEALAHELRLAQIRLPDMVAEAKGTPEWAANEQKKLNLALQEAEVMRTAKVDEARTIEAGKRQAAMDQNEAATAHESRVRGLKEREMASKGIATANLQKTEYEKRIKEIDEMERLQAEARAGMPGGMSVPYDDGGERERLRQAIAAQERAIKQMEAKAAPLPIAGEGETISSAEAMAEELRKKADAAAKAAEEARQALREAGIAARQSRELDQARAEERRGDIQGAVLDRAAADAKEEAARKKEQLLPTENLTPAAPPSNAPRPEPQAQQDAAPVVAAEVRGLGQRTGNARAKAEVEQLAKELEDGVSAQELERLRALATTLRQSSAQGMAEMASALDEFAATVAAGLGATRAAVSSLQGRINAMRGSAPGA